MGYSTLAHVSPGCKNFPNICHNRAAATVPFAVGRGLPAAHASDSYVAALFRDILHLRNRGPALDNLEQHAVTDAMAQASQ